MYDNYFQRVEEKYLLTNSQKEQILNKIKQYLVEDQYFESAIHNIYFDNAGNDLIINSLNKPIFKDKFRVRSYGLPTLNDGVFLEMKIKYKGIVGKRRIKISLQEFYDYLNFHKFDANNQIFREIDYYFTLYHLKPVIYIAYDRYSYRGKDDDNLRLTFDTNLRSRRTDLEFKEGVAMDKYFDKDDNYCIMEIKTLGAMPLWLVRTLSELQIMPTNFSKYGKIYEKEQTEGRLRYA